MISGKEYTICAHNLFGWNQFYLEKEIYEHLTLIAPLPLIRMEFDSEV